MTIAVGVAPGPSVAVAGLEELSGTPITETEGGAVTGLEQIPEQAWEVPPVPVVDLHDAGVGFYQQMISQLAGCI